MYILDRTRCLFRFYSVLQMSILFIFISSAAVAAPAITDVTQSADTLAITGSGFGTKLTAAPLKFVNFESDTAGQAPTGWDAPNAKKSLVSGSAAHSGSKSLDSSVLNATGEYFNRISWDIGTTIPLNGYLYLSAWLYLDKTGATATGFNWKGPIITSSKSPYYWDAQGTSTRNTAIGLAGFYGEYPASSGVYRWFNDAVVAQRSASGKSTNNTCNSAMGGNNWASDAFVFGNWQRIEWIYKASSAANAADGSVTVIRTGKSGNALTAATCITHGDTSDLWRYVSLPQGVTNIIGGTLNLGMYFDDVYIDNSLARVEICDSSTWSSRTHCEIQLPTAWAGDKIIINTRLGSFSIGQDIFIYVVDSNGAVNSNGSPFTIVATGAVLPAAPKSVTAVPVVPTVPVK